MFHFTSDAELMEMLDTAKHIDTESLGDADEQLSNEVPHTMFTIDSSIDLVEGMILLKFRCDSTKLFVSGREQLRNFCGRVIARGHAYTTVFE